MDLLTIDEVAAALRLTPYTVRKLLRAGKITGTKVGGTGSWRVRRSDLEKYAGSKVETRQQYAVALCAYIQAKGESSLSFLIECKAVVVLAGSKEEADSKAQHLAGEVFPASDGYTGHITSVVLAPQVDTFFAATQ